MNWRQAAATPVEASTSSFPRSRPRRRHADHDSQSVAAGVGNHLRAAGRGGGILELGTGRGNREGRVDAGQSGGRWRARRSRQREPARRSGTQRFTGYYRPEDMDVDPIALEEGVFRVCWANTGRMSHVGGGLVENGAVYSEIMCLVEEPPSAAVPMPATGTIPSVSRFVPGDLMAQMYDNVAFQPQQATWWCWKTAQPAVVTSSNQVHRPSFGATTSGCACPMEPTKTFSPTAASALRRCATRPPSRLDSSSRRREKGVRDPAAPGRRHCRR